MIGMLSFLPRNLAGTDGNPYSAIGIKMDIVRWRQGLPFHFE